MPITALPTPPLRSDGPATFADRGDTFLAALPAFVTQANALEANVDAKEASAVASAASAAAAAAAAGAIAWVSGTTYAIGDARYSPADMQTYRRKIAGAGTTDPSLDGTNWTRVNLAANSVTRSVRTSNTILGTGDRSTLIDITSGTFTQTFSAADTLTAGWFCYIRNSGTGIVTLDPNGAELIDGVATVAIAPGFTTLVACTGTAFVTIAIPVPAGNHAIVVTGGNGHGSTNTRIRRFTTTESSVGTHIVYADSATLGASFTIAAGGAGLYSIYYTDNWSVGEALHGVSINSAQLTTGIQSITAANRLCLTSNDAAGVIPVTITTRLADGDVIRPHTNNTNNATTLAAFVIRKVGV